MGFKLWPVDDEHIGLFEVGQRVYEDAQAGAWRIVDYDGVSTGYALFNGPQGTDVILEEDIGYYVKRIF